MQIRSAWGVRNQLAISCPQCRELIPGFRSQCACCGSILSVGQVVKETLGPHRDRLQGLVRQPEPISDWFNGSTCWPPWQGFWTTLGVLEARFADEWGMRAALSVVYLAVFVCALWIIPRSAIVAVGRGTSRPVRLGVLFNVMTVLILFQMFLATWWTRSLMVAGLFGAIFVGAWVFLRFLLPVTVDMVRVFDPSDRNSFDPQDPRDATSDLTRRKCRSGTTSLRTLKYPGAGRVLGIFCPL